LSVALSAFGAEADEDSVVLFVEEPDEESPLLLFPESVDVFRA